MKEGTIIGAQISPDGKMDYSGAARVLPREKVPLAKDRGGETRAGGDTDKEERSPEARKRYKQSRVIDAALEGFDFGDGGAKNQEWRKVLSDALKDESGSVTEEREDLIGPMVELAVRAFSVFKQPELYTPSILLEGKDQRQKAKDALQILFERYPERNFTPELNESLKRQVKKLEDELSSLGGWFDSGLSERLKSLFEKRLSKAIIVCEVDTITEQLIDNIYNFNESSESKERIPKALVVLKNLNSLRRSFFRHEPEKSPEEMLAINDKEAEAKGFA